MTELDLTAIKEREAAATPGPWGWFGNTDVRSVYLATKRWGRQFVMLFDRWGMSGAQPVFAVGRTWKPDPASMADFDFGTSVGTSVGGMTKAQHLPVYEVAPAATDRRDQRVYRADLIGIRHPDAVFIAAARQDVPKLIAEVERLQRLLGEPFPTSDAYENAMQALADAVARAELAEEERDEMRRQRDVALSEREVRP